MNLNAEIRNVYKKLSQCVALVMNYKYNVKGGEKTLVLKDEIKVKKGSGPRHLIFSPKGNFVYLLQELDGTLSVFEYQKDTNFGVFSFYLVSPIKAIISSKTSLLSVTSR